jgi:cob(I)alamin adenosyltransferase
VSKTDARVAAYGDVDELQAAIGVCAAHDVGVECADMLVTIQRDLFALGARLADPAHKIAARVSKIVVDDRSVTRLEQWIDGLEDTLPPLRHFILSGGAPGGAALHLARAVCRRAERSVLSLGADAVEAAVLIYLNRLSDLLFVMARFVNHRAGLPEIEW